MEEINKFLKESQESQENKETNKRNCQRPEN